MSVCIDIQSLVEMPIANCVGGDMDGRWTEIPEDNNVSSYHQKQI